MSYQHCTWISSPGNISTGGSSLCAYIYNTTAYDNIWTNKGNWISNANKSRLISLHVRWAPKDCSPSAAAWGYKHRFCVCVCGGGGCLTNTGIFNDHTLGQTHCQKTPKQVPRWSFSRTGVGGGGQNHQHLNPPPPTHTHTNPNYNLHNSPKLPQQYEPSGTF